MYCWFYYLQPTTIKLTEKNRTKRLKKVSKTPCYFNKNWFNNIFPETLPQKLALAFSARANFTEMAHLETTNADLNILYGLRTIAILVIIMDHRFGTFTSSALINFNYVESVSVFGTSLNESLRCDNFFSNLEHHLLV